MSTQRAHILRHNILRPARRLSFAESDAFSRLTEQRAVKLPPFRRVFGCAPTEINGPSTSRILSSAGIVAGP
jgi:hypothetical protein